MATANQLTTAQKGLDDELRRLYGSSGFMRRLNDRLWRFSVGLGKDKVTRAPKLVVIVHFNTREWACPRDLLTIGSLPYSQYVSRIPSRFGDFDVEVVEHEPAVGHSS